jgi:hypothetical protein
MSLIYSVSRDVETSSTFNQDPYTATRVTLEFDS